jgi:hypothetical protein
MKRFLLFILAWSILLSGCNKDSIQKESSSNKNIEEISNDDSNQQELQNNVDEFKENKSIELSLHQNIEKAKTIQKALPLELNLEGWIIGVSFSSLVDKLPENATIHYDSINYNSYTFMFDNIELSFSSNGDLSYIKTDIPGKGLNIGLFVGDQVSDLTEILGEPHESNIVSSGQIIHSYITDLYQLDFSVNEITIQEISVQYHYRASATDEELIAAYYNDYMVKTTPSKAQTSKEVSIVHPNDKSKTSFTKNELVELAIDVNNSLTLYYRTVYGSNGETMGDKKKILEERFERNKYWDKGLELEEAQTSIKKEDLDWYYFVIEFMDHVDSAYAFQIGAMNMIESGSSSKEEINSMMELAAMEAQSASELYDRAQSNLKFYFSP